jgi:catechol 2,3-dioxygenase-like lactoylglutathione lyase family enzyme
MLVVNDMEKAKIFYKDVLGLRVIMDFGANVTLTGGVALQTKESWKEFIHKDENEISFNGNNSELYL